MVRHQERHLDYSFAQKWTRADEAQTKGHFPTETLLKFIIIIIIIIDRFYIALFSAFEQTHCARMWFYMSE